MDTQLLASPAAIELPVEVVGSDLFGQQYMERTQTLAITRDGATILLASKLGPESELIVRNLKTDQEAIAQVVGSIREDTSGHVYGVVLLDPSVDLWRVPLQRMEYASSAILECSRCQVVRSLRLSEIEMEVFKTNRALTRRCRCGVTATIWKETTRVNSVEVEETSPARVPEAQPEAPTIWQERKYRRVAIEAVACIRFGGQEEIAACEEMSRGGFRFRSRKEYPAGTRIEAAVPYVPSNANIFVPAQIAYHQRLSDKLNRHGVAYLNTRRETGQK
jgi:hypothetical protein